MTKKIITEEELNLKRQARRRLLGAIALTILVVILLPMIMDSDPPVPSQDIDLKIPDKDKMGEFVPKMVLPPLDAGPAASPAASATVIAPLLNAKPVIAPAPAGEAAKAGAEPQSETEQESTQKKNEVKQSVKPEVKAVKKSAPKPHAGFVIQVGAFSNADGAKKLQEKLYKQGYASYTEKAGNKIRVRIGDYASHAEADKVRHKLEAQGMKSNVINLN